MINVARTSASLALVGAVFLSMSARAEAPVTIAIEASGELPGFRIQDASPYLASKMEGAGLAGWHFIARDPGRAAPDRIEWSFTLLPYAGGEVRRFFPMRETAADDEFFVSQYAPLFINSTFGWPAILGINLPDGGPAYPVARPGVRARLALSPRLTVTAGLFSGDPVANETGFDFHMNGDVFAIGEFAISMTNFALPATFKLGGWIHSGRFKDQRFGTGHLSLADPASNGIPASRRGDYGGYAILDQLLWRKDGTSDSGLGAFLRLGGNSAERNLIQFHADGGLSFAGPFGRDNDAVGLGISYEDVSAAQRALAADERRINGVAVPNPDFESALELTYQGQLASWWIIQPDLQWIIHPGGRVLNLQNPLSHPSAGALVLGLRTAVAL